MTERAPEHFTRIRNGSAKSSPMKGLSMTDPDRIPAPDAACALLVSQEAAEESRGAVAAVLSADAGWCGDATADSCGLAVEAGLERPVRLDFMGISSYFAFTVWAISLVETVLRST